MIDNASILFSTIMVLLVMFRALRLDASEPWFKPRRPRDTPPAEKPGPRWRR
jgi:hypothetical protein